MCASAPSVVMSTTVPRTITCSSWSFDEDADRDASVLPEVSVFTRPSAVLKRTSSPSRSIQIVETCGEPSGISVATLAKLGASMIRRSRRSACAEPYIPPQKRPGARMFAGVERGLESSVDVQRGDRRVAEAARTTDHRRDAAGLGDAPPEVVESVAVVGEADPGDPDADQRAVVGFAVEDRGRASRVDRHLDDDRRVDRLGAGDRRLARRRRPLTRRMSSVCSSISSGHPRARPRRGRPSRRPTREAGRRRGGGGRPGCPLGGDHEPPRTGSGRT